MARCWESRGCDEQMRATCPHAVSDEFSCPMSCAYAQCDLPQHQQTSDPALVFDPDIDRSASRKHVCSTCAFFLSSGPRVR